MSDIQKYPLLADLSRIKLHDQLPVGSVELGRCIDTTEAEDLYMLVKHEGHLSILRSYIRHLERGDRYSCHQYDFPLNALSWFPKTLIEFRKSPAEGGLHAGAMTTSDECVDGEMLCVQNASQGYYLVNRSRNDHAHYSGIYRPTEISLSSNFLYNLGFLDIWTRLGEKYENGEI